MNTETLLTDLTHRGVQVVRDGDRLRYRAPKGVMTPELRDLLTTHKRALLDRLAETSPAADSAPDAPPSDPTDADNRDPQVDVPQQPVVTISGRTFAYVPNWRDEVLTGDHIALDTETALIDGTAVPPLALASASSGAEHCLIHPDHVGAFVLAHRARRFVFQNVMFDFWVVAQHLEDRGEQEALRCWWAMVDEGRVHDTMILDMLVRLARTDAFPGYRDLAVLGREYAGLEITKDDPYRKRYGEIVGRDWADVEPGFFEYAIKDPIVTWHVHQTQREQAAALAEAAGVKPDVVARFGVLTETVQVKGAIALAQVTRTGMHVDLNRAASIHHGYRAALAEIADRIRAMPECDGLFKTRKTGEPILTRHQVPSISQSALRGILTGAATAITRESGQAIMIPTTPKGAVSISTKDWTEFAHQHPFVREWIDLMDTGKLCQFFSGLQVPIVHPRYGVLVRSGRSCASAPNIQQIPRKGGLREVIVPSPGHLLLTADYSFIELRTLAAECESRYGRSVLADVIRAGVDPHSHTAALLLGMGREEFMALAEGDPKRYKQLRQNAKALNFGIPGGLGPASLVQYARATYGVEMTLEEARDFRSRLIDDVYPELGQYLSEDGMAILARQLGVPVAHCWKRFDWKGDRSPGIVGGIRNVVRGKTHRMDGEPYSAQFLNGVWDGLNALNRNPELAQLLRNRAAGEELAKRLFWSGVTTLTGRVRGRVSFSQARNTPFQGLAADGAKLALWNLLRAGYRVSGFVHDEVLVELPDEGGSVAEAEARRVEAIMCRSMEEVTGSVPVACEFALARRWSKEAKAIIRDGRLYPWEPGS